MMEKNRRKGIVIMWKLLGLVKSLIPLICVAVFLGVLGYLCAIFLTILGGYGVLYGISQMLSWNEATVREAFFSSPEMIGGCLITLAVLRGILHYGEQYCNHYIAFKLLAVIRHKVFAALQTLCPAKLEGKDKGNLIAIITSDIELLEVFYAHTISPIGIAFFTCAIMVGFIGSQYPLAGVIALAGYVMVGVVIPLWNGRKGADTGMEFRNSFGELNSFLLDSLRGLDETIQYGKGKERMQQIDERSKKLGKVQKQLNERESFQGAFTNMVILLFSFGMLFFMLWNYNTQRVGYDQMVITTIAMMGSFAPVVALSNLSNNLNQTLASGERVLALLEEKPLVEEILGEPVEKPETEFKGAQVDNVTFAYEDERILTQYSLKIQPGKITGIHGVSGSGKSTLLKLLMRFWDVETGEVSVNGENVKCIPTKRLRDMESYVTQETYLFHDSIANNIAIAKLDATREEIVQAAKKASVHEFIMTLPDNYDTPVGELGDTLSSGEKQRIGIARAFLHDAELICLDEPTSNLDSLNEGIILKSLKEATEKKTVVLVSHRKSTMNVADVVYQMDNGRNS